MFIIKAPNRGYIFVKCECCGFEGQVCWKDAKTDGTDWFWACFTCDNWYKLNAAQRIYLYEKRGDA